MGGCCSCFKKSDVSPATSPRRQAVYGATNSGMPEPQRETERLVKAANIPEPSAVPRVNINPAEAVEEHVSPLGKIEEETPRQIAQDEDNVTSITPLPHDRLRALSDRTSSLSSTGTTSEETHSEGETSALVANAQNRRREKDMKGKKHGKHRHGRLVTKVNKTAGKMKKTITGKEKDGVEEKPKTTGSAEHLEKPRLGRVPSSKMKSKYAREKLEERERKEKEKYNSGFRDPRQAARERGEKLGELEDATSQLRNQAEGFAHTAELLRRQAMKK